MATIPSINTTKTYEKPVESAASFKNSLILGLPKDYGLPVYPDSFKMESNEREYEGHTKAKWVLDLQKNGSGTSFFSAINPENDPVSETLEISWTHSEDYKTITVDLKKNTGDTDKDYIFLTLADDEFTTYKSADGWIFNTVDIVMKKHKAKLKKVGEIAPFFVSKSGFKQEMLDAGFKEGDVELDMATSFFMQSASSKECIIARMGEDVNLATYLSNIKLGFYSFAISVVDKEEILKQAAEYAATSEKIFVGLYTNPANIKESWNSKRVFMICHDDLSTRIDCSYMGEFFGRSATSNSKFVTLEGEKENSFTLTEVKGLQKTNMNWYQFEGFKYVADGVLTDGSFLDSIYTVDMVEDRIKTELLNLESKNQKIPYDTTGEAMVSSVVRGSLLALGQEGYIANIESASNKSDLSDNGIYGFILDPIKFLDADADTKAKKKCKITIWIVIAGNLKQIELDLTFNL